MESGADALFDRVETLVDRSPSLADLRHHRIELLAAKSWRTRGRPVPAALVADERLAAAREIAAPALLERVSAASEEPFLLVKGPEVARLYADPSTRTFHDLDLIVEDAPALQRRLLRAGFEEVGDPALYEDIHHLRPLVWPGLPLLVEVHHSPKWVEGLRAPSAGELLAAARPRCGGPRDVLVLPHAQHALLLTAHAWAHRPLSRMRDLLDVAVTARAAGCDELEGLAASWGLCRVWTTTARAIERVLGDGPAPGSVLLWARHLPAAREQTVLESHVQNWLAGLWALPTTRGLRSAMAAVRTDLVPEDEESWPAKLARTRSALTNASVRKSQHDEALASMKGGR